MAWSGDTSDADIRTRRRFGGEGAIGGAGDRHRHLAPSRRRARCVGLCCLCRGGSCQSAQSQWNRQIGPGDRVQADTAGSGAGKTSKRKRAVRSVETARAEDALAIPSAAIVEEDGRPIAFVQVGGETFQKRDLELGIRDGNWVQVLSGITEGERVVTKGAYAVRLASVSSAIPAHGHVH